MNVLRRLSRPKLIALISATIALIAAFTAVAALAVSAGETPPARSLAQALHDAASGTKVAGFSADITFTNTLITSTSGLSSGDGSPAASNPLLSGASGRLWVSGDGSVRLELQSTRGDTEIVLTRTALSLYDAASNTFYRISLPASSASSADSNSGSSVPSVQSIQDVLTRLMGSLNISTAQPTNVGGAPAYRVSISPKQSGGLLGELTLAWDAAHGIPLDVAIYAKGTSTPVLELRASNVSFAPVDASVFSITPPPGTHIQAISPASWTTGASTRRTTHRVPVLSTTAAPAAVTTITSFTLDAPATLAGRAHTATRLLHWNGHDAALITYGSGPGAIAVIEVSSSVVGTRLRAQFGSLPHVQLPGATATELDTPLGGVLEFARGGVEHVIAGFVDSATLTAAARGL